MPKPSLNTLFLAIGCLLSLRTLAAKVDTIDVASAGMNRTFRATVVLPASYEKSKASFPVLYLLHGGYGHYNDWITKTPDKTVLHRLADQYNLIIAMPEGEVFSYYLDSPVRPDS